ncbi:MAG: PhoPQ-activated protein PqaA family protein, partial [Endozoicomonas sp.]
FLSLPKYMVTASGDNFIPPDSNKVFFPQLPGDKWIRVLPNQNHYIVREAPRLVSDTVESFYGAFLKGRPMPTLEWQEHPQHFSTHLAIKSSLQPKSARLWQAINPLARDFRKTTDNPGVSRYVDSPITFKCRQTCKAQIELSPPEKGWQASFVDVRYDNAPFQDLVFTTRVFVTPDRYPENKASIAGQAKKNIE